jgi:cytochrome c-type biogenesis protein CcmH/NrfF
VRNSTPIAEARVLRIAIMLALALVIGDHMIAIAAARISPDSVAEGLTCQCGCGLTVANCNHPQCEFSVPVRSQIERMIARGMNRAQIIATFRVKYGEKILSAPTAEGFNLLAWIIPFGALFAGGTLLVIAFTHWRSPASGPIAPIAAENPQFGVELRDKLESIVKETL